MDSVVVTQTLDWKLHAFDVLSEFEENNEASTGPMLVSSQLALMFPKYTVYCGKSPKLLFLRKG